MNPMNRETLKFIFHIICPTWYFLVSGCFNILSFKNPGSSCFGGSSEGDSIPGPGSKSAVTVKRLNECLQKTF